MSIESAREFFERMNTDDDFRKELNEKSSTEDRMQFVEESGFVFSKEEFEQVKSELSDEELDNLSGGHHDGSSHTGL